MSSFVDIMETKKSTLDIFLMLCDAEINNKIGVNMEAIIWLLAGSVYAMLWKITFTLMDIKRYMER